MSSLHVFVKLFLKYQEHVLEYKSIRKTVISISKSIKIKWLDYFLFRIHGIFYCLLLLF